MDTNSITRHAEAIKVLQNARHAARNTRFPANGLSSLQKSTMSLMTYGNKTWGFSNSPFTVKRQKIHHDIWKLTVENPKTREKILEVEGTGDSLFANEDHFARMAEAITQQGLKITTNFD
ncbi:MAG: hypothetical protein OEY61_05045 [Gammaproteobacteria bacterium]|nr:hypothetical protein [Gammaproteobacteria bacterium]